MNNEQITPEMERVLAESEAMLLEEAARARGEDPFADLRLFTPQEHATRSPDQILETTPADCSLQSPAEPVVKLTTGMPYPIYFGMEQAKQCFDALAKELEYLLERREIIAFRAVNALCQEYKKLPNGKMVRKYPTLNGFYPRESVKNALHDLAALSVQGYTIWYTLNTFRLGKSRDELHLTFAMETGEGVKGEDITHLLTFFVDFDPERPKGWEATAEENDAARAKAYETYDWLRTEYGFPEAQIVMSGNGYHLLWDIDLPATDEHEQLLQDAIYIISAKMKTDTVGGDTSVWNRDRQCKLPGTFSRKAAPTEERPQRLAETVFRPEKRECLEASLLRLFVNEHQDLLTIGRQRADAEKQAKVRTWNAEGSGFTKDQSNAKVVEFLTTNDLVYHTETSGGTIRYRIDGLGKEDVHYCPISEDIGIPHKSTMNHCHIDVAEDGAISAGCFGDSCKKALKERWLTEGVSCWAWLQSLFDPTFFEKQAEKRAKQERYARYAELNAVKASVEEAYKAARDGEGVKDAGSVIFDPENLPKGVSLTEPDDLPLTYETEDTWNDTGNGQRFVRLWGEDVRNVSPKGFGWYTWNGSFWERDEDNKRVLVYAKETASRIKDAIKNIPMPDPIPENATDEQKAQYKADMKDYKDQTDPIKDWSRQSGNQARLNAMLAMAACERKVSVSFEQLNKHPYLLPVQNGVVDLRTGELREAKREYLLTNQCPYPYFENADCPNWMKWIKTIFCGDEALMRYSQYASGSLLIGDNADQSMYFLYGSGKNGKSTMAEAISEVLGDGLSMLLDFRVMKQSESDTSRRDLAEMLGKRAVIVSESERNDTLAEGFIKRATGETHIVGERKYGHPFNVPVTFTMWVMTQHLPRIVGQDTGIWRRIRILPFLFTIPEEERDKHFIEHNFSREFPGILRWVVEGALMHQDVNEEEIMPKMCRDLLQSYREANDLFSEFVEKCLIISPEAFVSNEDLKLAAKSWGERNNALALTNAGVQSFINMFQNCSLTPDVKQGRHRILSGAQVRGFLGVKLSAEGMRGLIGKGRDDKSTMSGERA